jgi:hypothetical protein
MKITSYLLKVVSEYSNQFIYIFAVASHTQTKYPFIRHTTRIPCTKFKIQCMCTSLSARPWFSYMRNCISNSKVQEVTRNHTFLTMSGNFIRSSSRYKYIWNTKLNLLYKIPPFGKDSLSQAEEKKTGFHTHTHTHSHVNSSDSPIK